MAENKDSRFPEQDGPEKIHGTSDESSQKEKYLRDSGKLEDLPSQDDLAKMKAEPKKTEGDNPEQEGHTREWQDRARVVLDAKKDSKTESSPNQSPPY